MQPVFYESPIGTLCIEANETSIVKLYFCETSETVDTSCLTPIFRETMQQLDEYFSGIRTSFTVPILQQGTPFQLSVWNALQNIPYATTYTYQEIACTLGKPAAVRAVGASNKRNAIAIIVPCHRVIGKNGKMVGYASGVWRKEWLLQHEMKYAD